MKLPEQVKDIIRRFVARYPLWSMDDPVDGAVAEDTARRWSTQLAQQINYELPRQGWGKKRADPGRPISKDAIAKDGTPLLCWDILTGAGTGRPALVPDPDSEDITGQVFVPVDMVDHLREPEVGQPGNTEPDPEPALEPEPASTSGVEAALLRVSVRLDGMEAQLRDLQSRPFQAISAPTVTYPDYHAEGKIEGGRFLGPLPFGVTLKPVKS